MKAATEKAIDEILERGNTAEVKRRKNGEIIVLEVKRKIKVSENPAPQTGGAESRTGL